MDIREREYTAKNIASKADVETLESYKDKIHQYKNRNFTYIPIPSDEKYYDMDETLVEDLSQEQYVSVDTHLMEVLEKMRNQRFLLIDLEPNYYLVSETDDPYIISIFKEEPNRSISEGSLHTTEELGEKYPELADRETRDYDERYMIITLADLNKRRVREMLYVLFAGLASELSNKIEEEYPDSEPLLEYLRADTIGRWKKERLQGLNLHVSEHMNLIGMLQVIQSSDKEFVERCGFESKNDVGTLSSINDIRNHVMHANRSLIYERSGIDDVLEAANEAQRILSNIEG